MTGAYELAGVAAWLLFATLYDAQRRLRNGVQPAIAYMLCRVHVYRKRSVLLCAVG